jgi:hypothetical protein
MQAYIISFVLGFVFAATHVAAQTQSAPFNLVISSANATLNGSLLAVCHENAAIESLCLGGAPTDSYAQYNLNYTSQDPSSTPSPIPGTIGILVCTFPMNIQNCLTTILIRIQGMGTSRWKLQPLVPAVVSR